MDAPGARVTASRTHAADIGQRQVIARLDGGSRTHLEIQVVNRPGRFTLGFLSPMGVAPLFLSVEQRRVG